MAKEKYEHVIGQLRTSVTALNSNCRRSGDFRGMIVGNRNTICFLLTLCRGAEQLCLLYVPLAQLV